MTSTEEVLLLPQVDPEYKKEAGLMELNVLLCFTYPCSRQQQHMNNVKKLCNNTVQYADQLQRNLEGNRFNQ